VSRARSMSSVPAWRNATPAFARALFGALLVAAVAAPLGAQDAVARDCAPEIVANLTAAELREWAGRHPDTVFAKLADDMRRNAWSAVLDTLARRFDEAVGAAGTGALPSGAQASIRAELDALAPLFAHIEATPSVRSLGNAPAAHWQLIGDPDTPRYDLFRGTPARRVTVDERTPQAGRRAVCWTALAVRRVLVFLNEPGRLVVVSRLEELENLWNNYARHGHSQLPWELWLNGKLGLRRGVLEPPRLQLVVLHAAPALEVTGRYPEWNRVDAVLLEIAGLVAYNDARTTYLATTGFASATSSLPVGWGPMLHVGRAVKVGYAFRERGSDGQRHNGLLLSADLFGFLLDAPELVRVRTLEALQKKLSCLTGRC
jgi:hypothetical protein